MHMHVSFSEFQFVSASVIQTVFTADRICSLSALSVNAVLVQTEGTS